MAAMDAGAAGYVCKQADRDVYLAGVRSVVSGGIYVYCPSRGGGAAMPVMVGQVLAGTSAAGGSTSRAVPPRTGTRPTLSDREQQTLAHVGAGFTHCQTARRMGVSKATVDTYTARIRGKLLLGNKAGLALAALRYVEPHSRPLIGVGGGQDQHSAPQVPTRA